MNTFLLLQEELVSKVEKMRQAILEGINLSRPPPPPPPLPPPAFLPPTMVPPFYPMPPLYPPRPMGSMPPHHHPHHPHHPAQHRPRAFPGWFLYTDYTQLASELDFSFVNAYKSMVYSKQSVWILSWRVTVLWPWYMLVLINMRFYQYSHNYKGIPLLWNWNCLQELLLNNI